MTVAPSGGALQSPMATGWMQGGVRSGGREGRQPQPLPSAAFRGPDSQHACLVLAAHPTALGVGVVALSELSLWVNFWGVASSTFPLITFPTKFHSRFFACLSLYVAESSCPIFQGPERTSVTNLNAVRMMANSWPPPLPCSLASHAHSWDPLPHLDIVGHLFGLQIIITSHG